MNCHDKIIEMHSILSEQEFKDELTKLLRGKMLSVRKSNRLIMHFKTKYDIIKTILDNHPNVSSVNFKEYVRFGFVDGIKLILQYTKPPKGIIRHVVFSGNVESVKIILENNPHGVSFDDVFKTIYSKNRVPDAILEMVIDCHYKTHANFPYFRLIVHALAKKYYSFIDYAIKNFNKWKCHRSKLGYIDCLIYCALYRYDETSIYKSMRHFFPNVNYIGAVRMFMCCGCKKQLQAILTDKPRFIEGAFDYLLSPGEHFPLQTWEVVIAFAQPHAFKIPPHVKHDVEIFLKKFNGDPGQMIKNLRNKLLICNHASMIFAMTIFLCDDFLIIK